MSENKNGLRESERNENVVLFSKIESMPEKYKNVLHTLPATLKMKLEDDAKHCLNSQVKST